MSEKIDYERVLHQRAAKLIKVHGILAIIFGALGTLFGAIFLLVLLISPSAVTSNSDYGFTLFSLILGFAFWVVPHAYLLFSGIHLVRQPAPGIVKVYVILNLILGVFWNTVILIFAILNLVQLNDYSQGYKKHKE